MISCKIDGVYCRELVINRDNRGSLCELFRFDELPDWFRPAMGYVSTTEPGLVRGPHEHVKQSDCFCFVGPSNFTLTLWDERKDSPTYGIFDWFLVGHDRPALIIVPPGVVHGYYNVGGVSGVVYNFPNQLYAGYGRTEEVDEIRHEDDPNAPFVVKL